MAKAKRIQFEFSTEAATRLDLLRDKTKRQSYAEVVRDGLRILEWFDNMRGEGFEIGLVKDDRLVKVVEFVF
jgi:Arc/MetJ-type ribon-helix-helix transcriptional regulator